MGKLTHKDLCKITNQKCIFDLILNFLFRFFFYYLRQNKISHIRRKTPWKTQKQHISKKLFYLKIYFSIEV